MGIIIKDLKLADEDYSVFNNEDETENKILRNLSKINIFVGENNSGKSRLLRSIIKNKELEFSPNYDLNSLNETIADITHKISEYTERNLNNTDIGNKIFSILEKFEEIKIIKTGENPLNPIINLIEYKDELKSQINATIHNLDVSEIGVTIESILDQSFVDFNLSFENINLIYEFQKLYIPILRGLRPFDGGDIYKKRTEDDYFSTKNNGEEGVDNKIIVTGLDSYQEIMEHLLGTLEQRNLIVEFQNFLSEQYFDNNQVTLIPDLKEEKILRIKIGEEKEKEIYNLGDGIQAILIMTLPLFLYKDKLETENNQNMLIFIEEPEQLLHPGLQRNIMNIFSSDKFSKFQFFFTTHSNHFLDITFDFNDISIFTIRKKFDEGDEAEKDPKFLIENISHGDKTALDLLGVRNTSVFLSNCTIWVEGVTDRYYIKHYFDKYQEFMKSNNTNFKEFREDYHYSFVEYGGNNITHWSFLDNEDELDTEERINVDRLCARLFLIADSDNAEVGSKKFERRQKLQQKLNDKFYPLTAKEIENTLSKEVILEVVKDYECKNKNREDLNYNENFNEIPHENLSLGEFIEDKILEGNINRDGGYKIGNTIKRKDDFCKKALNHINEYDDLSEEAKLICEMLYKFVKNHN